MKPRHKKPLTAQQLCDAARRRAPHLVFFIGDPPCAHCRRKARCKRGGK